MISFSVLCDLCKKEVDDGQVNNMELIEAYETFYCSECEVSSKNFFKCKGCKKLYPKFRKSNQPYCSVCMYYYTCQLKYGITREDIYRLKMKQKFRCGICKQHETSKRLVVDHCHATGKVRGLLCGECNSALGLLKDSTITLRNAIKYLGGKIN